MRKIYIDHLPKWEMGRYKGKVKWDETLGYEVEFEYDDISGALTIIDVYYEGRSKYILMKYGDRIKRTTSSDFLKCRLGNLLGTKTTSYLYNVGDTIYNANRGEILIESQTKKLHRRRDRNDTWEKAYEYSCLICGNSDEIEETALKKGSGCNVCSGKKVLKGFNDIASTNPELVKYFLDLEDAFMYSLGSDSVVKFICRDCGDIRSVKIYDYFKSKVACRRCGDGVSYPSKFVDECIRQLDQVYDREKVFSWSEKRAYDFYTHSERCIIEVHGEQHYKESFTSIKTNKRIRSLEEEQANDDYKMKLASQNDISHYVVLDCRRSQIDFIRSSILNSKLAELFDLSVVDWNKCHEFACSTLVKRACNYWNEGKESTVEIGQIMKLSPPTILKYLKQGSVLGWCNYSIEIARKYGGKKANRGNKRKVICLNTKKVFSSIKEAKALFNTRGITKCCMNNGYYSGISPSSEYLQWQYYDDYLDSPKRLLTYDEIDEIKEILKEFAGVSSKIGGIRYSLTGLVHCGKCESSMVTVKKVDKNNTRYTIAGCRKMDSITGIRCNNPSIGMGKLCNEVVNRFYKDVLSQMSETDFNNLAKLENNTVSLIDDLINKLRNYMDLEIVSNNIKDLKQARIKILSVNENLETSSVEMIIRWYYGQVKLQEEVCDESLCTIEDYMTRFNLMTFENQNKLLGYFIRYILVIDQSITHIEWSEGIRQFLSNRI